MSWLAHAQLLDSALPIGAFSHSFGLETLVQQQRVTTIEHLGEYCRAMLWGSWAPCDAMAVAGVYRFAPQQQWDELWRLDEELHVTRAASETREGLQKMGKRLWHLGRSIHPNLEWAPLAEAIETGQCPGTYPLIYGWLCWQLGVTLEAAAQGYLYACLSAAVTNAVRLMRIGQTQGQTLLAQLLPEVDAAWTRFALQNPFDFWTNVPEIEVAMMQHATLYSRLFMS